MSEKSNGAIYAATGTRSVQLLEVSVARLREVEPNLKIAIFTDRAQAERIAKLEIKNCDVHILEEPTYSNFDKVLALTKTPFDKAIFLDADTLAVRPFSEELFEALEYSPILARSAGIGFNREWEYKEYPAAIPQFNTGVLAYRFPDTREVFEIWARSSSGMHQQKAMDQPFFRAACIKVSKIPSELPAHYNFQDNDMAVFPVRIRHCILTKEVMLDAAKREKHLKLLTTMQTPCRIYKDRIAFANKGFTEAFVLALLLEMVPQRARKLRKSIRNFIRRIIGKPPKQHSWRPPRSREEKLWCCLRIAQIADWPIHNPRPDSIRGGSGGLTPLGFTRFPIPPARRRGSCFASPSLAQILAIAYSRASNDPAGRFPHARAQVPHRCHSR